MEATNERETTPRVVVGVDGSTGSQSALRWAAEEARRRAALLEAVFVYPYPHVNFVLEEPALIPGHVHEEAEEAAREHLDAAIRAAGVDVDAVELRPRVVEGRTADRLLALANGADLLVVGSRGLGGFRGLVLGSVSQQCVQHARCPVVVVPETVTVPPDRQVRSAAR